ncbi:uncharacterized protein A4U43_C01F31770 [Asparagus officinalis]|uniref:Uncharacterized protein n=1 Tax=Asparagus officinalis TaxID=4686 RepID=A0A5P1FWK2_ASPOF|nr:uncharacterized protein A4U43_C01F31770 [Asparagus officinalis]
MRIAKDQVILPALGEEFSFAQEHSEEESQLNNFRHIIEKVLCTIANSSSSESHSSLLSHTDEIMNSIQRLLENEEAEVLPLVRLHLCPEKQRELLYKSICVMPLKFLERAIPWFVATLTEQETKSFLQNIQMAASSSDSALVTLLSGWASVCHSQEIASSRTFVCLPSKLVACCPFEKKGQIQEDYCRVFSVCPFPLISRAESAYLQMENYRRPLKRCNFLEACANTSESTYNINIQQPSYDKQAQCAPRSGLRRNNLWITLPADKSSHVNLIILLLHHLIRASFWRVQELFHQMGMIKLGL